MVFETLAFLLGIAAIIFAAGKTYQMVTGCKHKWKLLDEVGVYTSESDSMPVYRRYVMQCEHCGNLKTETNRK